MRIFVYLGVFIVFDRLMRLGVDACFILVEEGIDSAAVFFSLYKALV